MANQNPALSPYVTATVSRISALCAVDLAVFDDPTAFPRVSSRLAIRIDNSRKEWFDSIAERSRYAYAGSPVIVYLRNYASSECVAFPQITRIVAHLECVAYPERAQILYNMWTA
jgi:hypothetical protein